MIQYIIPFRRSYNMDDNKGNNPPPPPPPPPNSNTGVEIREGGRDGAQAK